MTDHRIKKRRNPRLKAEAAYENAHLVARDLLDRIGEILIDGMPAPGNDECPINWEHVGTLSAVNNQLSDVIRFLGGDEQ